MVFVQNGLTVLDNRFSIAPSRCPSDHPLPPTPPISPSPCKEGLQRFTSEEEEESSSSCTESLTDLTLTPDNYSELGLVVTEEGACCMPSEGSIDN